MVRGLAIKLLSSVFIVAGIVTAQTKQPEPSLKETLERMQSTLGREWY